MNSVKVIGGQSYKLPEVHHNSVQQCLAEWKADDRVRRLWAGDPSLWTGQDEVRWLGWLNIVQSQQTDSLHLKNIADDIKQSGFKHAVLLGMGGSSLCPEVMSMTFGQINGFPHLQILDSTDPAQIKALERSMNLSQTVCIVSSKSGSTLEPNIYKQYFWERMKQVVGEENVGRRFIAITDPGSKMHRIAEQEGFRHIFFGLPSIGGRYSALSDFGMVPAAVMGVDVSNLLARAQQMVAACGPSAPLTENPGVLLGIVLGTGNILGRDKVTLVASPKIYDLGAWLEQLLAESTGKSGKGIIPVDREKLGPPGVYGTDRLFVYLRLTSAPDEVQDRAVEKLEGAGHPVVRISIDDIYQLGQEFFRWEVAVAVAGSVMSINAFNQPDVEASKVATRDLTSAYERSGYLPPESPLFEGDGIRLFADERNAQALSRLVGSQKTLADYLRAHLNRLDADDYFALLAYVQMSAGNELVLQAMRHRVRDGKKVATCLGFGPRFLHSTGQAYKGGPNSGVFLQITCDDLEDIAVPGQKYTFGVVKQAQSRGDFQVLAERGRRALRVHLGSDLETSLKVLDNAFKQALQ